MWIQPIGNLGSAWVADMEVEMVANMVADKVAHIVADMFKTKCIKSEVF